MINNDLQNNTLKTKDRTQATHKTGGELRCLTRSVSSSWFTDGTRRVTAKRHEQHMIWKSFSHQK